MGKLEEPSLNEREFVLEALRQGKRVDGREMLDYRPIRIHLSPTQVGLVEVELGKTRILAKVSCEIVRPKPDRPTEGFLQFFSEFTPMGSVTFEAGRSSEEEVVLSRMLEKSLKGSRAIDTEGLCIVAGKMVWSIRVDIHLLDHDGNLVDCASIAAISALLHFRRPDITVIGEEVTIEGYGVGGRILNGIESNPSLDSSVMVVDGTLLEEQLRTGDLIVSMNNYRELCALSKAGGCPLEMQRIVRCCDLAYTKITGINEMIQELLKEDQQKRYRGVNRKRCVHPARESKQGGLMTRKKKQ